MGRFLRSGRGRFTLLLVVVGAGSLAVMGSSCAPKPVKPQPPTETGLSIEPTSQDFGNGAVPKSFTVKNNGPDASGTLVVETVLDDKGDFVVAPPGADNNCTGETLAPDGTCTVQVTFVPSGASGGRLTTLRASSDKAADGTAEAALTGTVPE